MTRYLSGMRGGGLVLATGTACGVLIGRFLLPRQGIRPDARPAWPRLAPRAQAAAVPRQGPGLLAGDDELLRLADREEAWW